MTALRWFVAGPPPDDSGSHAASSSGGLRRNQRDAVKHASVGLSSNAEQAQENGREAQCVAAVRAGDASALDNLAREHAAALREFALAFVRASDVADDIVQEVFLRIWVNRDTWQVRGSLRGYLFGAVRNEALRRMRHARVAQRAGQGFLHDAFSPAMGTAPLAADTQVEIDEIERALAQAVRTLGERQQEILLLRVRHGLMPAEIAKVTGMSAGAVRTALSRIRDLLRPVLARFDTQISS